MKIAITNAAPETIDRIVLMTKEQIAKLGLSDAETAWVQQRMDEGQTHIAVNQYTRSLQLLIVAESKKPRWQTLDKLRKQAGSALRATQNNKRNQVILIDLRQETDLLTATIEGIILASYQFNKYFSKADRKRTSIDALLVQTDALNEQQLTELGNLCESVLMARTWVNEPVLSLPSHEYAKQIAELNSIAGLDVTVRTKAWIEQQAMGGLLAVNRGSIDEPQFVELQWKPANARNAQPYVLVGKGIVFDTGGLNIKTGGYMEHMKSDMAGSAAVAALMRALALNNAAVWVKAYIPITDNRPGGNAYAPGDVIKMHNGMFVEVLNTDAEGRMILADALSYAQADNPLLVIDVATLTGSAQAALGDHAAVTMGSASDECFERLLNTSLRVGERLVRFPLWDEYADDIKSLVGDIKNTGGPNAGAITAGKFLEYFTNYPWIHIDMSGKSFLKSNDDYRGQGGTGFGVRLLYAFLTEGNL